jgi:uncharacterized protein (TIGR02246 family)
MNSDSTATASDTTTSTTQGSSTDDLHSPAPRFFSTLQAAWNSGDGERFGAEFAEITDFITIRGEHFHGGPSLIAAGHQKIFDTIYLGSTNTIEVDCVREVAPGCLLAHATSTLDAPTGPLTGRHHSKMSTVLVEHDGTWKATAFHNTLIAS